MFGILRKLTIGDILAAKQSGDGVSHVLTDRRAYAAGYSDRQRKLAPDCEGVRADAYFRGYCEALCDEIDAATIDARDNAAAHDAAIADLSALDDDNGRHNWWGLADESHSAQ